MLCLHSTRTCPNPQWCKMGTNAAGKYNLHFGDFRVYALTASRAIVATLAIFALLRGRKNACWGVSPNPVTSGQVVPKSWRAAPSVRGPTLTRRALTLGQSVPKRKPGYGTNCPPVRQMWKAFCKKYENKEIGLPTPKVQL